MPQIQTCSWYQQVPCSGYRVTLKDAFTLSALCQTFLLWTNSQMNTNIRDHSTVMVDIIQAASLKERSGKTRQYMTRIAILMTARATTYTISSAKMPLPIVTRFSKGTSTACRPSPFSITAAVINICAFCCILQTLTDSIHGKIGEDKCKRDKHEPVVPAIVSG